MSYRLLAPIDGSRESASALPFLALLARRSSSTVILLRCYDEAMQRYLTSTFSLAGQPVATAPLMPLDLWPALEALGDVRPQVELRFGDPLREILRETDRCDAVLLVARRLGQGGSPWRCQGIVAGLLRKSCKPVIVLPPSKSGDPPKLETVLVLLEGTQLGQPALSAAREMAAQVRAKLLILAPADRVSERRKQRARRELRGLVHCCRGMKVEAHLVDDLRPTQGLLRTVSRFQPHLVVVPRPARGHWWHWRAVSALLSRVRCPLMVVP